jgi:uncharacterized protein
VIRPTLRVGLLATLLCCVIAPAAFAQDFPEFTNYLVDDAGVIPDGIEQQINAELEGFEDRSGNQLAVAVIDTVGDESLENYTIDLAREWKIGAGGKDNGLLLLLAIEDRQSRIEVGDELEGDVTDVETGRILRGQMRDLLRSGDYGEAVLVATRQIRALLGDTSVDVPAPPDEPARPSRDIGSFFWIIPFLIFGPLSAIGRRGRRRRGWFVPVFWGGGWGGGGSSGGFGGGFGGGGGGGGFSGGGASGDW